MNKQILLVAGAMLVAACGRDDAPEQTQPATQPAQEQPTAVQVYAGQEERMSPEEIERGRMDPSWRRVVQLDTVPEDETAELDESLEDISPEAVNQAATALPLQGDVSGPSVLRAQVLLDRALFSPGIIDGRWGKNTEKAVYWFQDREGLSRSGAMNEETFERLRQVAGDPQEIVRRHRLTEEDVEGPFVTIPDDRYEQAEMDCMCYESLSEKLGEMFHTSAELLERLNPDTDLNGLSAGDEIWVPAVRDGGADAGADVDRIVISDAGFYLHALDADGRILYHFPTTLGSQYSPSPTGEYRVTAIAHDPTWHYQPELLEGVEDDEPDAVIPPGPNNAVGVVWMQLSRPHYGIHGTNSPETIGYATSNGCVRLTNWDAEFLSERISEGVPVDFRDVDGRGAEGGGG